jgi:ABC-type antimicrobial peptide transport system permease subunit
MLGSAFIVDYDQATLLALQALESQSVPLYELLTGVSVVVMTVVIFLVSYLVAVRRKWEPGLLMTQGWTWARYARFMLFYCFVLATVASALGAIVSFVIERFLQYQYTVFGNILTITVTINPTYLLSAIPLSFLISGTASLLSISRMKRMGLDSILRDY